MTKNYENPNCAAFFFEDGDFLNLEEVSSVEYIDEPYVNNEGENIEDVPELRIHLSGTDVCLLRGASTGAKSDRKPLLDALRIYHSKF